MSAAAAPARTWTPGVNHWIIAASVMLATFMEVLDTSVANVALPHIAGNLSATTDESTWVLTSYLVSNAIVLPATNWIAHYIGRKRFLIACVIVFTLSSALCGAATSLPLLIFARVLQGAGGGALQPISQAILLESFPQEKRGQAMALFGLGVIVAPIIGPTLGGWITDNYSWRWIFYINVPIGILAVLMTSAFIQDPPYIREQKPGRIDYIGFGLMAVGLAAFQIMLDKGQEDDWFSSVFITWLVVITVVALAAFVVWELRSKEPIVNLRVLKNRNFATGTMLIAAMGIVLYGSTALLPLFLQTLLGYPATESGMAVSPRGIGAVLSMIIVGRLVGRVDGSYLIMFGFAVLAFSTHMLADLNLNLAMSNIVWPMVVSGFAMGFIFVPLTTMAMGTLPNEQIGNATGVFNLMRNIGGSIGISAMSTLLSRGAQAHQAVISSHVTPYDPAFQQRIEQIQGATGAVGGLVSPEALASVYGEVVRQSTLLSFMDNFRLLALLCLLCVPVALLFRRVVVKKGGPVVMH
jgi:DHA2 family multidrug resistance protein